MSKKANSSSYEKYFLKPASKDKFPCWKLLRDYNVGIYLKPVLKLVNVGCKRMARFI